MGLLIHSFFTSDFVELVFQLSEFNGKFYGDIRQFVHSGRYTGPTKHGLNLSSSHLQQLTAILEANKKAISDAKKEELISKMPYKKNSFVIVSLVESNLDDNPVCLDIREYLELPQYKGFSKKGFRIPMDLIEEFIEGCRLLRESIEMRMKII